MAIGTAAALLGSAVVGAIASNNAANTQASAANAANAQSQAQYNQTRADLAPWRQAGAQALGQMQNPSFQHTFGMSDFTADPGYQFSLQQGQQALERSAAARGNLMSGATLKAISNYGQNAGLQEYGSVRDAYNQDQSTRFNRLASIAGAGQTAVNNTDAAGAQNAQTIGNNTLSAGAAQAAGQVGSANAITNAAGQGLNSWMQNQYLNKFFPNTAGANPVAGEQGTGYSIPSAPTSYQSQYLGSIGGESNPFNGTGPLASYGN